MDKKPEAHDPTAHDAAQAVEPTSTGAPDPAGLARIDAEEFARLQADAQARSSAKEEERAALEHETRAERDGQARREVLQKAWREQEEYTRAVAQLKDKPDRRASLRVLAIAAVILLGAGALGAVLYSIRPVQNQMSEAEALRIASEARVRREEEARAKLAAELPSKDAEAKSVAEPEEDLVAEARAEDAKKAAASVKEAARAAPRPGTVFQDCPDCPRMVVIPAGEFTMGSPAAEAERGVDEGPQRQVSISQPFALGRSEVTVAEFRRFVEESGYKTEAERDPRVQGCSGFIYAEPVGRSAEPEKVTSGRSPGLAQAQADPHPVLCVSWNDARAYGQWLSKKTGKRYRLPTESEWEYAARAGSTTSRYWGDDPVQACRFANVADQSRFQTWSFGQKHECIDGHYFTAPAGGYAPNRFGLYDMLGNVWEWTEDCWNASYAGAPSDGAAWLTGDCAQRVCRGGSWSTVPRYARSATRHKNPSDYRDNLTGFRLARTLE